jgi:hypothetical protein
MLVVPIWYLQLAFVPSLFMMEMGNGYEIACQKKKKKKKTKISPEIILLIDYFLNENRT